MQPVMVDRLKGYQLKTMMRLLGAPRSMLGIAVDDRKKWITEFAAANEDRNARVRQVYEAVIKGAVPQQQQQQSDDGEAVSELRQQVDQLTKAVQLLEQKKSPSAYKPIEVAGVVKPKALKVKPHAAFERALQLASQRVNTFLVGPAGCGKTFLGQQLAEALDLDFGSISCSGGMSESQLAGWLLPVGDKGKFSYVPSHFITIYEKGGVFLLDETDSADPNTLTFLNKAIANDGFFVPQRFEKPYVKRHKDFVCIAAANTFGNGADSLYVGRNQLDAATLDRFRAGTVAMDYDRELEGQLIHPKVLEWGWNVREKIYANKLRRIMSTRVMLDLTKMTEAYKWDRAKWEESYFSDWSSDERRRVAA